jgi:hypothetical protein
MEQAQPCRIFAAVGRAAVIVGQVLDDITVLDDCREELAHLLPWLTTGRSIAASSTKHWLSPRSARSVQHEGHRAG